MRLFKRFRRKDVPPPEPDPDEAILAEIERKEARREELAREREELAREIVQLLAKLRQPY